MMPLDRKVVRVFLDGDPAPFPKGAQVPPIFLPMSIVAKRSPISATVEQLFYVLNCLMYGLL